MGPPRLLLLCLMLWSCTRLMQGEESAGQDCGGLDGCYNIFTLGVYSGDSQSLSISHNADWVKLVKLVKKCDHGTKTWKEEMMTAFGEAESFTNSTTSISLVGGNFTVQNAEKTEGGLYKIELYLNNSCLAVVNVTVLDFPLPLTAAPSFDVSTVTSKVTEPPEAPGTDYTAVYVTSAVAVCILIATVFLIKQKLIKKKSKCRRKKTTSEVDPECLMNGSPPPQQEESPPV